MSGTAGDPVQVPSIAVSNPARATAPPAGDDVSIVAVDPDGNAITVAGWQGIVIRVGIEIVPASFELEATEFAPDQLASITLEAGWTCQVRIGNQLVITGYIDAVVRSIGPDSHAVRVVGRSKSQDLVDSCAVFSTYQIHNTTALQLAQSLAQPYGIPVRAVGDIGTAQIPQFDVVLTETPFEIIERVCRYAALLAYDAPTGGLVLARAGSTQAASGFAEGVNVESAAVTRTANELFSEIRAILQTTDSALYTPDDATLTGSLDTDTEALAEYPGTMRYRPLLIPVEQGDVDYAVTKQRVQWEMNRRIGRSQAVQLTCDGWRDAALALWAPNTLAPVALPSLKAAPAEPWLIAEVTFRRDESGTHADVVLMPPAAFAPEPIVLQPLAAPVAQALNQGGAAAGPT